MKIHPLIVATALGAIVALQTWTLKEVVALKVHVAQIQTKLSLPVATTSTTQLAKQ